MITKEFSEIGAFLRRNQNELIILSGGMLFLILNEEHNIYSRWADSLLFYGLGPILLLLLILRKNPLDFGLRIGNFRIWGAHVLAACLVSLPVMLIAAQFSSFEDYYTINDFSLPTYLLKTLGYMAGWEFIFRGYLLFGLKKRFGEGAILIQMIPFLFLHLGKPEIEVLSTIPMGIYFGYVSYRGNSFWPAFLIHVFINVTFRAIVNY